MFAAVIPVYIKSFPKPDNLNTHPFGHSIIEVNGTDHCRRASILSIGNYSNFEGGVRGNN